MTLRRIVCAALCPALFATAALPAAAESIDSYNTYVYNAWGEAVSSSHGYQPAGVLYGEDFGCGPLSEPSDLFVADDGTVYIADSGNNRILCLDSEWQLIREITELIGPQGEAESLKYPTGVFCDTQGRLYVADRDNFRVVRFGKDNVIDRIYEKPQSEIISEELVFKPTKVLADSSGWTYILVGGLYMGAMLFDDQAQFIGFFGSNSVNASPATFLQDFLQIFFTEEQLKKQLRSVPVEYSNFTIDDRDFIYTCTSAMSAGSSLQTLKKSNFSGKNIFTAPSDDRKATANQFGDLQFAYEQGSRIDTAFTDLYVDDEGFVTAVDSTRGRVFQYDSATNLTFAFGGRGSARGNFVFPIAVDGRGEELFVLDQNRGTVTIFIPTPLGRAVRAALQEYNAGRYVESLALWDEVLKVSSNYDLAYVGLGKAYYQMGEYEKAMTYFEQGNDTRGRSQAFERWRSAFLNRNIIWLALGLVGFVAAVSVVCHIRRKRKRKL